MLILSRSDTDITSVCFVGRDNPGCKFCFNFPSKISFDFLKCLSRTMSTSLSKFLIWRLIPALMLLKELYCIPELVRLSSLSHASQQILEWLQYKIYRDARSVPLETQ